MYAPVKYNLVKSHVCLHLSGKHYENLSYTFQANLLAIAKIAHL